MVVDLLASGAGLVRGAGDVTPAWLEAVLRAANALEDGVSVESLVAERVGEGVGILSIILRVTPSYSGPTSAPSSLVVKFPTDDPGQRFTADALGFYRREVVFYRDHAASAPFGTAKCWAAGIEEDSTDFTLVVDDVGGLRFLNQLEGISLDDARALLRVLADFHASWWCRPELAAMSALFRPLSNETYDFVLPMLWEQGWPTVLEHAPDAVPAELASIGDRWPKRSSWILGELMEPMTLCHGDWRADNLLFDGDRPVALDFQIVGVGSGIYDVGYFLSQSLRPEVRRGHDRELLGEYLARLVAHGISVDPDAAWRQYRLTVAFCVIYSVTSFPQFANMNDRGKALLVDMLDRALRAVADVDALAALG